MCHLIIPFFVPNFVDPGVRGSISSIRTQINILAVENNFLTRTVDNLQSTLDPLKTLEDELNNIATSQGSNVGELIALMKENESMSSKMKVRLCRYNQLVDFHITILIFSLFLL